MRVDYSEKGLSLTTATLHVSKDSCASEHGLRSLGCFVEFLVAVPVSLLAVLIAVEGLVAGFAGGGDLALSSTGPAPGITEYISISSAI
jgi:hydrogenase/urease accessory protein HupE